MYRRSIEDVREPQKVSFSTALLNLLLFAAFFILPSCTPDAAPTRLPGSQLRARAEARIDTNRDTLRASIGHYALVDAVSQQDLHGFMAQIHPRRDGPDIVMAAAGGIELHGGGVLELIATLWQPDGRPAALDDAFPFASNKRAVALREIYDSHRMQIFLPVPGIAASSIDGRLPESPQLPRTLMQHTFNGRSEQTELDAYNVLALLLRFQRDLHATWTNRVGQRLSAATLFEATWDHYLLPRSADEEFSDHSYLHLIELLLAYHRRPDTNTQHHPNELKQRLLAVELERREYGGYAASEALGHYVESLGFLIADPAVTWTPEEQARVRTWLRDLETVRLVDLDDAPVQHLTHLLSGLEQIEAHAERVQ